MDLNSFFCNVVKIEPVLGDLLEHSLGEDFSVIVR